MYFDSINGVLIENYLQLEPELSQILQEKVLVLTLTICRSCLSSPFEQ